VQPSSVPPIVLIGGPTASGKSALALALGQALALRKQNAVILNADALQLYRDLSVLTARPTLEDEAAFPHRLYGVLDGSERGSVAGWLALIKEEIEAALAEGWIPLVVGGTGMYLHTLQNGLAQVPEIDPEVRAESVLLHGRIGGRAFKQELAQLDPTGAAKLHDGDTQRLIRAYEVIKSTNRPLHEWQSQQSDKPPAHWRFTSFVVEPTRPTLYANCDRRFDVMLEKGAMDEVKQLLTRDLSPELPVMKAVGVPELAAVMRGTWTIDQAREKAQQSTRNYAKRQLTWFRHQLPGATRMEINSASDIAPAAAQMHTIVTRFA